jgi:uncharacterized protein YfcZ (UPF0381/DUF406 family)
MILSYYGIKLTTDQISAKIGVQGIVNFNQIHSALASFGYTIIGSPYHTLTDLKFSIDNDIPALVIVHYGDLPGRQDPYTGGHAIVVTGYDDNYIYTNDPDFYSPKRCEGFVKAYPTAAFNKAWLSTADGNAGGNLWYLDLKLPLSSHCVKLQEQLDVVTEDRNKWREKYEDLDRKYIQEIKEKTQHIEDLQQTIAELNNTITQLTSSQASFDEKIAKVEKEVRDIEGEKQLLTDALEECNKENVRLTMKLQDINNPEDWITKIINWLKGGGSK